MKRKKSAEPCLCIKPLGSLEPCWRIGGLRCSWEGRVRFLLQCRHVRSSEFRHRVKPIKNWEDMEEPNQSRTETEKLRLCREINGANCRVQNKRTHTICWTWAPGSQLAQAEEREAMRGRKGGRERKKRGGSSQWCKQRAEWCLQKAEATLDSNKPCTMYINPSAAKCGIYHHQLLPGQRPNSMDILQEEKPL